MQWGLVPGWAKDKDFKALINARLETIDEKVSFKKLIKNFRCVVVADGFYEWKREKKNLKITEKASENIKEIHHRQPVILNH